ncbi:cadherin-87A [Neocloeon triangulifer]|uniref:cadherin-87A n=1 Tax=Neocloeon triangulifer TaxID=2078957 RepID=UPI00286F4509|nr:cadherin-87A [Neocloeon triangulifer]
MRVSIIWPFAFFLLLSAELSWANEPPQLLKDLDNLALSESTAPGSVVFELQAIDPEGAPVRYGLDPNPYLAVDPSSGKVTLIKSLDREQVESFLVGVTVSDDDPANVVTSTASIIVVDENDSPPKFEKPHYEAEIGESTKIGHTVIKSIKAFDADLVGETLEITCRELPQLVGSCDWFEVSVNFANTSAIEAALILRSQLDYAKKQLFQFELQVTDGVHVTTTPVQITIQDEQNLPPVFEGSMAGFVDEDAPIGTLVLTVSARDGDRGRPRHVSYELVTNPDDYFLLDSNTGELRIAKPLDREALDNLAGVINLTVKAKEDTDPDEDDALSSSTAHYTITVRDVNDEAPKFDKREYSAVIPENILPGSPIPGLDITVTDPDVGNNSAFKLTLVDGFGFFAIDQKKAVGSSSVTVHTTNQSLDYENPNQRKFFLQIVAEETNTSQRLSSTASLVISVQDVNDNAPVFAEESYVVVVSEDAKPGTVISSITATDMDSGKFGTSGLVYSLKGDGAERFVVGKKTGVISVAECPEGKLGVSPCLDFETKADYYLSYKATDDDGEGQSVTVPLKISLTDANDNPPHFIHPGYRAQVDEGSTKFDSFLIVQAEDPDITSKITYSIIDGDPQNMFNLDPSSGEFTIRAKDGVSGAEEIILGIRASDGRFFDDTTIKLTIRDINNNAPVFDMESYVTSIPEDINIGSSIERIHASDADTGNNSRINYFIESGAFEHFKVNPQSGVIDVVAKLDFDRISLYKIKLLAVDGGTPSLTGTATLTVNIIDSNDKQAVFTPVTQRAEVSEDAAVGTMVHQLLADDPDVEGPDGLEYAIVEPYSFVDTSGKQVTPSDELKAFFDVNKNTGAVHVASKLDRQKVAVVRLTVRVTDTSAKKLQEGLGTLVITIVGVNERSPEFPAPWTHEKPQLKVSLSEEMPIGTVVGNFEATDPDSASITKYEINPESKYFEINNLTGIVKTKQRIDFEETSELSFRIVAWDSGQPPLSSAAHVTVNINNVNDEAPMFLKDNYQGSVRENSPSGTFVAQVSAVDKDKGEFGKVSYALQGDKSNEFSIDNNGILRVLNPKVLDRESTAEINIQVVATDGAEPPNQKSASVPVKIIIEDENDQLPKFEQQTWRAVINEDIPVRSKIIQLRASDDDPTSYLSYKIIDGDPQKIFYLEQVTGILYTNQSLKELTRGETKDVVLTAKVDDGIHIDEAKVRLTIQAVNQHQPIFVIPALSNASVEVPENAGLPNYLVMTVKAKDADMGENGRVTYHLKSAGGLLVQDTDEFSIDADTGELRTRDILDREQQAKYELVLVAKDNGYPNSYETLSFLTVLLMDSNDNEPEFPPPEGNQPFTYRFKVLENGPKDEVIGTVHADDADEGFNAKVYYTLVSGGDDSFSVGKTDGKVRSKLSLDREMKESYSLLIKASNDPDYDPERVGKEILIGGENVLRNQRSVVQVIITVLDENDNAPSFEKTEFYAGVNAMSQENDQVAQISAIDPDKGGKETLDYLLRASNLYPPGSNVSSGSLVPSPFKVSQNGRISTTTPMLEYNQGRFILKLVARETVAPYREAETMVHVWVYDQSQLVRVILSRPPEKVHSDRNEVTSGLSTATQGLVVLDDIKYHVDDRGQLMHNWSDMYLAVVDPATMGIIPVPQVLKLVDSNYDTLRDYYSGFDIQNVISAKSSEIMDEKIDTALAALVALLVVLVVGFISFFVVCCCLRHWVLPIPGQNLTHGRKETLIQKGTADEPNCTTENPLWMEQTLKLYEEQELTMQVFCENENRLDSSDNQVETQSNMYATLQPPPRAAPRILLGHNPGETSDYPAYAEVQSVRDLMSGFHGSTFQPPLHHGTMDY